MSPRPRLLDLFCSAGGASMGYHRAGFDVTGVDIVAQPRYPFAFICGDALEYVVAHGHEYDCLHASPPCQAYSPLNAVVGYRHTLDLLPVTRERLRAAGLPYVIENVASAPLDWCITLCGEMFNLRTYRHRRFESNYLLLSPPHPKHPVLTSTKKRRACWDAGLNVSVTGDVGVYVGAEALGISWMTGNELSQAIPPAYTEFIGRQLIAALEWEALQDCRQAVRGCLPPPQQKEATR